MALSKIFEPITINKLEIKNRIVRTGHGEHLGHVYVDDRLIAYHEARAKGGCGLSILGAATVDPSSATLSVIADDGVINRFRRLMERADNYGMRVFQQLWHGGYLYNSMSGDPPPSVSLVPSPNPSHFAPYPVVGVPMDKAEISRLIAAFAAAAVRCREGGLHGVELHAAHSYIFYQFLSPVTNTRGDEYGGSLENRMRFLVEVYCAVRQAVGDDFIVGARLSATQQVRGLHENELRVVAHTLQKMGIDYFTAGWGDYFRLETMIGGMQEPMGYEIPSASQIFADITVPKIMAGRIRTLEEAEQLLRDGRLDMVGMVRAQIADPDLVRKTMEGRADQVRPCIACNQGCIGGVMRGTGLGCAVNASAGFEAELSEDLIKPAIEPRKVVVVGGGPAGMEAARVARLCGHDTTLFEAAQSLGGALLAARKPARQHAIGDIANWLESEIYRLGVDVRLSTYIEASDIEEMGADVVLVATGSRPRMDGWQVCDPSAPATGIDLPHVLSSTDLMMSPPAKLGNSALVVDNVGHFEASVVAIHLIEQGMEVTMLTSTREYAPFVRSTDRDDSMLEMMYRGDFTLLVNHKLEEVRIGECVVRPVPSQRMKVIPADLVVLVTPNLPNRELFDELRQSDCRVELIGDAKSPRDLQMAIRDGHRAARAIA